MTRPEPIPFDARASLAAAVPLAIRTDPHGAVRVPAALTPCSAPPVWADAVTGAGPDLPTRLAFGLFVQPPIGLGAPIAVARFRGPAGLQIGGQPMPRLRCEDAVLDAALRPGQPGFSNGLGGEFGNA